MLTMILLMITPSEPIVAPEDSAELEVSLLISRANSGDDSAFEILVDRYGKFVYNTACRVLRAAGGSSFDADDVAQNSFIKAWRSLSSFRGDCSFSTWLFRITANTARDYIRSESRMSTVSLTRDDADDDGEEWDVPVTSGDVIPEDSLEKKELIIGVRRAIELLPEDQRQVIVLRDIHELSYSDIAERLGIEIGTVKSRISRGRANLKTILENGNFI